MKNSVFKRVLLKCLPNDEIVGPDGSVYMRRYYVAKTRFGWVRIHEILRSDQDRHLHDHPWNFISLILSGGYTEHTPEGVRKYGPMSLLYRRAEALHRLTLEGTAWTFVVTGPKKRSWGFQTERGWVYYRDYEKVLAEVEGR